MTKVKISDVAREAGVSLGTVSNALNHPDKVRPDTLALIEDAIEKLGYIPNQAARQLAGSESRVFGLVLPRLDHAFSLQIANGAQAESWEYGYGLLIASAGNDDILGNRYMRYFLGAHLAGVLAQPMAGVAWEPPNEETPIPTVFLDIHSDVAPNCIAADNLAQGRMMAEHALACGARNIAVIGKASFMQLALRVRGIGEAVRAADAKVEYVDFGGWNTAEDGFLLGQDLAEREGDKRPDFVIGLTDVLAAGAIKGILSTGLSVPRDILVAGCDGNPLAWSGPVPLTTIKSPGYELGRRGVQYLMSSLSKTELEVPEPNAAPIEPKLLVRASTMPRSEASGQAGNHDDVSGLNLGEFL